MHFHVQYFHLIHWSPRNARHPTSDAPNALHMPEMRAIDQVTVHNSQVLDRLSTLQSAHGWEVSLLNRWLLAPSGYVGQQAV